VPLCLGPKIQRPDCCQGVHLSGRPDAHAAREDQAQESVDQDERGEDDRWSGPRKKIKLADVTKFYQGVWTNLVFEGGQRFSQLRLDWTPEENALLLIYAKHLFSSSNRSEAVRVLLNYYAVQNKFATVGQVKKAVITPN